MVLRIKRIYEAAEASDGTRILVDRLWPRGVKKNAVDLWLKDVAPSDDLREWFHHAEQKWAAFRARYRKELAGNPDAVAELRKAAKGTATLLYGARDEKHNQAVVLAEYLRTPKPAKRKKAVSSRKAAPKKKARAS
jgi:uncharacterized protein YeaO (DUF488 family)